jgi:hypothetical protein
MQLYGHLQGKVAICTFRHGLCDKLLAILGAATVDMSASGLYSNTAPQHDAYGRNYLRFAHLISTNPCIVSGESIRLPCSNCHVIKTSVNLINKHHRGWSEKSDTIRQDMHHDHHVGPSQLEVPFVQIGESKRTGTWPAPSTSKSIAYAGQCVGSCFRWFKRSIVDSNKNHLRTSHKEYIASIC